MLTLNMDLATAGEIGLFEFLRSKGFDPDKQPSAPSAEDLQAESVFNEAMEDMDSGRVYGRTLREYVIEHFSRYLQHGRTEAMTEWGAPQPEAQLTVEQATTIGEAIIMEYQRLEKGGYTHWHKQNIGRMVQAGVNAALAAQAKKVKDDKY